MHSFTSPNSLVSFSHNGDFSGLIIVSKKQTGREMFVPFDVFKGAVSRWVAHTLQVRLSAATPDEILAGKLPVLANPDCRTSFQFFVKAEVRDGGEFSVTYLPGDHPPSLHIKNEGPQEITLDFDSVKAYVAHWMSRQLEARISDANPDLILSGAY